MSKKRMRNGAFLGIWIPVIVLFGGLALTIELLANSTAIKSVLDTYVGKGAAHIAQVEDAADWDTNYYNPKYPQNENAGGNADTKADAEDTVEKICDEGMVLIKNNNHALPLDEDANVTLLGRGSVDPVYGGSGSGNVDTKTCANPKSGLEYAGLTVDEGAYNFFKNNYSKYDRQNIAMDNYSGSTFFIGEIPTNTYNFVVNGGYTAVVFISRCGGEGLDLSTNLKRDVNTSSSQQRINANANTKSEVQNYVDGQHQLELSKEEKDMISFAKTNYDKVVVVLNESTTVEIGELMDDDGIDAIIWAGSPGSTGFNSLGKILAGKVNPSGRTPDLYVRDFTADPTFQNFAINGVNEYTGINEATIPGGNNGSKKAHFVEYEEGIYVGYRYYETRGEIEGEAWYNANVAVPFGHGLSYTSFDKEIVSHSVAGNEITVKVKVTNTGNKAGKEVVQLYYSAPYINGGLEKSSTVLGDFAKTKLLNAGQSEEVTLSIKIDDMASYDYKDAKAWVLDAGDYTLQIKEDSHTVSTHNSAKLGFTHHENAKRVLDKKESDKVNVTNQFDDVSAIFKDSSTEGYALNMSRANFSSTFPTKATAADADALEISILGKDLTEYFKPFSLDDVEIEGATLPTTGASHGLSASGMRGVDYDDESYEWLLDQLTDADYEGINAILVNCAYASKGVDSVGLADSELHDGPQGFSSLYGSLSNVCAYMSEPLLAATFNKELAKEMGTVIGEEALSFNPKYTGWYGPAMNTHRSPFAGRNFEYYSEDGVLAGKIAAEVCAGAGDKGLVVFIKHFALNDQETWRTEHLATWANEQAMREVYLRPFEIAVKEAKTNLKYLDENGEVHYKEINATTGVMSSFNYVGAVWAGGRRDLMTNVLRNEWGFRGIASSDFNLYDYMYADQGTWAGTDLQLTWWGGGFGKSVGITDTTSAKGRTMIRTAIHNLVYTMANSNAMQGVAPGSRVWYEMSPWRIGLYAGEGALAFLAVGALAWVIIRMILVKKKVDGETSEAAE